MSAVSEDKRPNCCPSRNERTRILPALYANGHVQPIRGAAWFERLSSCWRRSFLRFGWTLLLLSLAIKRRLSRRSDLFSTIYVVWSDGPACGRSRLLPLILLGVVLPALKHGASRSALKPRLCGFTATSSVFGATGSAGFASSFSYKWFSWLSIFRLSFQHLLWCCRFCFYFLSSCTQSMQLCSIPCSDSFFHTWWVATSKL